MDDERSEGCLALRQIEVRLLALEMALTAKQLGASSSPDAGEHIHQLERELVQTRAQHAAVWRHLAVEQRRRARANLTLAAALGLGLLGFAFALSSSGSRA